MNDNATMMAESRGLSLSSPCDHLCLTPHTQLYPGQAVTAQVQARETQKNSEPCGHTLIRGTRVLEEVVMTMMVRLEPAHL